ncbi:Asp-tRNA(Asn)/Glu-tRNA(Gln) amidotransferase subunit GatC [Sediminivirga luteola]|uniref:Aspartyl/glutamyl-tRNA(Asn/Gln) amidotransferase subunit C n=1 Tax=Sediminivirga luteola TaxID=1774748 RepID=A0A8J2TXH1_9MICO|nr:Asp-tRNA(Asn)/Glu-tRNA(Gln) amidotransferase subunit GatC [Sediminivirga luteola]MCI2266610.1 Asp-tRNA(Asn)/Glu-tRNA(Gln) amidotransferase subunit GatC [Sediminivirga luteola]GGA12669.1 aspartyl/glutamyl-tRNA(Asn/Gln) amidotransferase subunit C [Sediminivirga luteola]
MPGEITTEQVAHLAQLARIAADEQELAQLSQDLGKILGAVARVQEIATDEVPATSHPIPLSNVYREDVPVPTLTQEEALSGAPEAAEGKFAVPQILGEE